VLKSIIVFEYNDVILMVVCSNIFLPIFCALQGGIIGIVCFNGGQFGYYEFYKYEENEK